MLSWFIRLQRSYSQMYYQVMCKKGINGKRDKQAECDGTEE